ncbi:hypothetical protein TNCV_163861 [Trichonephila clavipes]|nr:hypothetical protein TNCV_163861 [Trichonephila clavipes]
MAKVVRRVLTASKNLQKFKRLVCWQTTKEEEKENYELITERRVIHQVKIDPKISAPKIAASTSNTLGRSVSAETHEEV